ncbi:MAG TPA: hypothetical protein VI365_34400 [Trebonia sp.]
MIAQWKAVVAAGGACVTVDPTPNTNAALPGQDREVIVQLPRCR